MLFALAKRVLHAGALEGGREHVRERLHEQHVGPAELPRLRAVRPKHAPRSLASLHDEHGNTTVDGLDATHQWQGAEDPVEQFRRDANVLDGVELLGDGSVADLLWARPSA